jgi:hypothetical protein
MAKKVGKLQKWPYLKIHNCHTIVRKVVKCCSLKFIKVSKIQKKVRFSDFISNLFSKNISTILSDH